MKRLISGCIVAGAMGFSAAPAAPQGTACDSPCKVIYLPLIREKDRPVPNSNPLAELQGKVSGSNRVSGANQAYFEYQVDKPAVIAPGSPEPLFPEAFKNAKIEGEVVASFVVDTTGIADVATFRILKSSHPLFSEAVRDAIATMRFVPAEIAGGRVRELMQHPFAFTLPH